MLKENYGILTKNNIKGIVVYGGFIIPDEL